VTQHVKIKVFCDGGHLVGEYTDEVNEKYPFFCYQCPDHPRDLREGKYPWYLTTEIVDGEPLGGAAPAAS
jgi:hypothetical protein